MSAGNKMNDFVNRFGKAPKGLGLGVKLLAAAGAAAYGVSQSIYTGKFYIFLAGI
jgi:prohibitin 2